MGSVRRPYVQDRTDAARREARYRAGWRGGSAARRPAAARAWRNRPHRLPAGRKLRLRAPEPRHQAEPPIPDRTGLRRNRRRHGGRLAHSQQPAPSRPAAAGGRRPSVAGLGAAARAATARVGGGNGAPAIVCTNAASACGATAAPTAGRSPLAAARHMPPELRRHAILPGPPARRTPQPRQPARSSRRQHLRGHAATGAAAAAALPISIGRVLDPCHADRTIRSRAIAPAAPPAADAESQVCRLDKRRHAGHAGWAAAAERADQHGLCLVARVVSQQQMQNTRICAGRANAAKRASRARSAIAPGPRPWIPRIVWRCRAHQAARPSPRPRCRTRHAAHDRPSAPASDPPRLRPRRAASRASAMLSAPPDTPAAIRGAGSNGPSAAMRAANSSSVTTHLRAVHLQPARWPDAAISSRRSGRGLGYSPRSFASVSQAAFFSLMAINELARPSRASGACAPFLDRL